LINIKNPASWGDRVFIGNILAEYFRDIFYGNILGENILRG
jgi:hypothetical protein